MGACGLHRAPTTISSPFVPVYSVLRGERRNCPLRRYPPQAAIALGLRRALPQGQLWRSPRRTELGRQRGGRLIAACHPRTVIVIADGFWCAPCETSPRESRPYTNGGVYPKGAHQKTTRRYQLLRGWQRVDTLISPCCLRNSVLRGERRSCPQERCQPQARSAITECCWMDDAGLGTGTH